MKQSTKKSAIGLGATIVGGALGTVLLPGIGTVAGAALGASLGGAVGGGVAKMLPDDPLKKKIDVSIGQGNSYSPYMDTLGKSNVDVNTTMVEQGPTSLSKVFDITNQAVQTGASLYSSASVHNPVSQVGNTTTPTIASNTLGLKPTSLDDYWNKELNKQGAFSMKPKQSFTFPK